MAKVLRKLVHSINTVEYVMLLLLCLTTAAHASPESQTLVAEGRALLFNNGHPTYSGIIAADDKFDAAVAADSTDQEANLFYAVSRLMAFALEEGDTSAIDTLRELVESFGMTRTSYDRVEDGPPFTEPPQISEHLDLPDTSPSGEQVRAFLASPFVALLSDMLGNLDKVTDTFTTTLTVAEMGGEAVEIDYGDVLLARAVLSMAKSAILIVTAYNLDVDIRELIALGNANIFNIQQNLLDKYQDVFKLIPTDGLQSLSDAKTALLNGIAFYRSALDFVKEETDNQADDLFYFGADEDLREARHAQTILNEAHDSLNENRAATFTFIEEDWVLTDVNDKRLGMEIEKDANGNFITGDVWGLDGCEFLVCSGWVEEFTVSGTDVTIRVSSGGQCPCSATLTGILSGGQIINGTFDAINCERSWSGQFTGALHKTETDTHHIDFNRLFGNTGKDPLNIREVLPEFDQCNEILPGTFPPTDDSSPVLNGLSLDHQTNDDLTRELDLQPSGEFLIPEVSEGAINVQDADLSDWTGINPVFTDITGEKTCGDRSGDDISALYLAKDSQHLYVRMALTEPPNTLSDDSGHMQYYVFWKDRIEGEPVGDLYNRVTFDSGNWHVSVGELHAEVFGDHPSGFAQAVGNDLEWKVPLSELELPLTGRYLFVLTQWVDPYGGYYWHDFNETGLRVGPLSFVSGTINCPAYDGAGNIFIWAYDGSDPNTANELGSTYITAPGLYTITGLPIGADVYLFAMWDADGNGIKTYGDYLGMSGPYVVEAGGTKDIAFNVDEEYDTFIEKVLVWGGNSPDGPFLRLACFMWGLAPWDVESLIVYGPGGSAYAFNIEDDIRTHYEFGTYYRHKVSGTLPEGRYDFVLRDREGHEYHAEKYFTPNLIDMVDMSVGISPAGNDYVNTTTPSFSWAAVTDEAIGTLHYRIRIMDWNRSVTVYTSDRSPDTTVTVPDGFLEPDTAYKWQVQVFDRESDFDADNFSSSEWMGFSTGAVYEPLTAEQVYVRSKVKVSPDDDQTQFRIKVIGPAPDDVRSITVTGPEGFSYSFNTGDLRTDGVYFHREGGILPDGIYAFTVVDDRDEATISVDKAFYFNRLSIPEHLFGVPDKAYIKTTIPTFGWYPVTDETADPVYYRIHIFDYRGNTVYKSDRSTATTATLPVGILKLNNPYYWRVEVFDDASEPQNSVNTWTQSFYVLKDNPTGTISGLIDPASSGYTPGGALYVVVFDAPWPDGNMLTYTALTDVGTYTLYNLPVDSEFYVYVLWDKDGSENPTPGDWLGEYSNNPIALTEGANPANIDIALDNEVQATSLSGQITCSNFQADQGQIYVGVFDGPDPDTDNLLGGTSIVAPGAYSVSNLPVGSRGWIFAYWDANGSGSDGPDVGDYTGSYAANPVTLSSENNAGIDMDLDYEMPDLRPTSVANISIYPGSVIPGVSVDITATVTDLDGISLVTVELESPDETIIDTVTLFDDGLHNDGASGDHTYGNSWATPSDSEVTYYLDIIAVDGSSNSCTFDSIASFSTQYPITPSSTGVVKLVDSYLLDAATYQSGETVYVLLFDSDLNTDPAGQESVEVQISSNTDNTGETVTLTETSADTSVFTGSIALNDSGTPVDGQLDVTSGDTITVIYQDASDDWGNSGMAVDTAVYSATVVSGPITEDTVWVVANSPYLVTGDVTVNEGVTLTIEPGAKVMFLANSDDQESGWGIYDSELIVHGTLVAQGTSANRIVFTSSDRNAEPNDWYGIVFSNGEGTVEYCQIEYGQYGIYVQNASPTISSNIISNNAYYGIYCSYSNPVIEGNTISNNNSSGIYCTDSSPVIDNNQISNNNGIGIICYSSSSASNYASPQISNNTISGSNYGIYCIYSNPVIEGNTISNNNSSGIYCTDSSPVIDNNQISNNNGMGIYCYSSSASNYASPQISNNTISGSNYGIQCYGCSTPSITSNTISDNRYVGIRFNFYANTDISQTISGNTITGNGTGITLSSYSSPTINQNNLYGNTNYDIQNYTANDIDAKNNWWGDPAYAEMEAGGNPKDMPTIYDYYNNTSYGMVNYSGWLDEEALFPPTALIGIEGNGAIYLSWTPVVAAVGYKVYYGTSSGTYEESVDAGNTTKDCAVEGLINNTTYYIVVTAYDGNGNESGYSAQIKATPTLSGGTMGFISFDREYYNLTDTAVITLKDGDLNTAPGSIQDVNVQVISDSDSRGITITLSEPEPDSGVFTSTAFGNDLGFTSEDSDDVNELIRVADGDTVTVVYNDLTPSLTRTAKAMIDASPPETTLTPSGDLYYDGQDYYAPISFSYSLSATDSYSGVERIEYSIDGLIFVEFTEAFALDSEGSHAINYRALDKAGNWEETKTSDIIVDNTPPAAPTGLSGSQVNFQVNLTWNVNSEADFLGYNIYRDGTKINTELRTWANYSELIVSGKTYVYNVTGVDIVGNESAFSDSVSISIVSTAPTITEPLGGTSFADSEITVRGTAEPGATVEILVNAVSQGTTVASSTGSFSLSGVQISEGENSITAISTNTYGETSPVSSAVTVPLDARPQPPAGLVAATGDTVVTITWEANTETDVQGYHIYRDGSRLNENLMTETTFTDTRLTNGKAYTYTVTAVDNMGSESNKTSTITVTPVAGPEWEVP